MTPTGEWPEGRTSTNPPLDPERAAEELAYRRLVDFPSDAAFAIWAYDIYLADGPGAVLRALRKHFGYNTDRMAECLGCHRTTIARIEKGTIYPGRSTIRRFLSVLDRPSRQKSLVLLMFEYAPINPRQRLATELTKLCREAGVPLPGNLAAGAGQQERPTQGRQEGGAE